MGDVRCMDSWSGPTDPTTLLLYGDILTNGQKPRDLPSLSAGTVALSVSPSSRHHSDDDITGEVYRCHLCSYSGTSNNQLKAHMDMHFDHKCRFCDYTSRTEGRLKRHIRDFHSEVPPDSWAGSQVPRGSAGDTSDNGQFSDGGSQETGTQNPGKPRKYRCKQCAFVAICKTDFWEHNKTHIKSEKLLTCPKCPFVTEYKHHLEYHLRNHFGSKPFKCAKCNYSCVNKSMLNSHMKSHSNVYQYRCSDCSYATKYCHSLKLHLRKYNHKPATVLNLDGTPNPYPIIDVYGTRRGPRPKKRKGDGPSGPASEGGLTPTKSVRTSPEQAMSVSVASHSSVSMSPVSSPPPNMSPMSFMNGPPPMGPLVPTSMFPMGFPFLSYPGIFSSGMLAMPSAPPMSLADLPSPMMVKQPPPRTSPPLQASKPPTPLPKTPSPKTQKPTQLRAPSPVVPSPTSNAAHDLSRIEARIAEHTQRLQQLHQQQVDEKSRGKMHEKNGDGDSAGGHGQVGAPLKCSFCNFTAVVRELYLRCVGNNHMCTNCDPNDSPLDLRKLTLGDGRCFLE